MSNALRNVAESTAHAWSDLVDEARELVDDARERIEDLPPLSRVKRHKSNKRWTVMAIVGALVVLMFVARRRQQHDGPDDKESTTGGRMAEKSLAVS
jgi:hypothetical protein